MIVVKDTIYYLIAMSFVEKWHANFMFQNILVAQRQGTNFWVVHNFVTAQ